jgi:sugar phosphate isomerase/epimerase
MKRNIIILLLPAMLFSQNLSGRLYLVGNDFSSWRVPHGDWQVGGQALMRMDDHKFLALEAGSGVISNGAAGKTNNIISQTEFGDARLHVEFMMAQGSNSGVYVQGRYEIQVYDSWGVAKPGYIDCGGIYQRWDDSRQPQGYEGLPPRVNASLPPGEWQTFDALFRAPRFVNGKKTENARFIKVVHNGIVVHQDAAVTGPTRSSTYNDEQPLGPLMLQGDHGPVAYRNIWVAPLSENDFFAMDTGTRDDRHRTMAEQVAMVKALGYNGIDHTGCERLAEKLYHVTQNGMTLYAIYLDGHIDGDKPAINPGLKEAIQMLRGRETKLWLPLQSKKIAPSSAAGDEQAIALVRQIADLAAESGLDVVLYPHYGCWMEKVQDAYRLVKKVDRANVGLTFNLCHWLRVGGGDSYAAVLKEIAPYLRMVTVNGAEKEGEWKQLIQPLDRGAFDVAKLIRTLHELHYAGPIGLQGFGIGGDVEQNLSRSMSVWRTINSK